METPWDVFIIGGGINGTAIAADIAGRGLSVMLCEKNDLGSGTSSASSKLIHGGLRYLEFYEFGLVRKALHEREILLFRAPHLVSPLKFILPHEKHLRPAWLIRLGLFLYDHLSKRKKLPRSTSVDLQASIYGKELLPHLKKGFSYYDCFTDDARLVILNALSAKNNGASILTNMEFLFAAREKKGWKIQLKNTKTHEIVNHYAKVLMNVAGSWVKDVQKNIKGSAVSFDIVLDKGSHIVVPKLYEGDFAYILQNKDQRIIFAIPFQENYTLVGTTDVNYSDNLDKVHISEEEKNYLCDSINQYFKHSIQKNNIVWSYSGVRCLQASKHPHSAATTSRDFNYLIDSNDAPLFTVIGGKLTTHRTLAEHLVDTLKNYFPNIKPSSTAITPLPGGDIPDQNIEKFYAELKKEWRWLPDVMLKRYVKNYGTLVYRLLKNCHSMTDLGKDFSHTLYQREVEYLIQEEWAKTAEDILWRRTKLGLFFSEQEVEALNQWIKNLSSSSSELK